MEGPFEAFEDAFAAFAGSDEAVDAFHVSKDCAYRIGRGHEPFGELRL